MENVTWKEEGILASHLWSIPKSLEPMSAEEERTAWRKTVKVLDNLCGLSDALMLDPLILALTDALMRSREELARAEDRLARPSDWGYASEAGGPRPPTERREMDKQKRRERELEALELIAAELERLRVLKEHELGVRLKETEGDLHVRSAETR
jgi:hypothetical protein